MAHLLAVCHCVSSFHPGAGVSVSHLDLPVQREKGTDLPMMQGSGFKGALRAVARQKFSKDTLNKIFGPEPESAHDYAGAAKFTDLRLLLFPVKSLKGIFTWICCPTVLARFERELKSFGFKGLPSFEKMEKQIESLADDKALVGSECNILLGENKVVLEDFTFEVKKDLSLKEIAEKIASYVFPEEEFFKEHLSKNLILVSDMVFASFAEFSMEVITRIKIDPEKGTVATGALWNEENLPAESVLYGFVLLEDSSRGLTAQQIAKKLQELSGHHQFGGNATVGRGIVRLNFFEEV